jgi:hypothetical protein
MQTSTSQEQTRLVICLRIHLRMHYSLHTLSEWRVCVNSARLRTVAAARSDWPDVLVSTLGAMLIFEMTSVVGSKRITPNHWLEFVLKCPMVSIPRSQSDHTISFRSRCRSSVSSSYSGSSLVPLLSRTRKGRSNNIRIIMLSCDKAGLQWSSRIFLVLLKHRH